MLFAEKRSPPRPPFPNSDQPGRVFRVDLGPNGGNGHSVRKRIIDIVEKIAAGCFLGAIFQRQESPDKVLPWVWGIAMLALCLFLQWNADKRILK